MKLKDLRANPAWQTALTNARTLWYAHSEAAFKQYGDAGACTLGGGIYAYVIHPRCRKPQRTLVLSPPYPVQGEVALYAGMEQALKLLRAAFPGIEFYGDHGRMD